MATTSGIGIVEDNGIECIYCHYDGYISHNGRILLKYYSDKNIIKALMSLGDIASLGIIPIIEPNKHFSEKLEGTLLSKRCRPLLTFGKKTTKLLEDKLAFSQHFAESSYLYLWEDGQWYVSQNGGKWEDLDRAIVLDALMNG